MTHKNILSFAAILGCLLFTVASLTVVCAQDSLKGNENILATPERMRNPSLNEMKTKEIIEKNTLITSEKAKNPNRKEKNNKQSSSAISVSSEKTKKTE